MKVVVLDEMNEVSGFFAWDIFSYEFWWIIIC